MHSGAPREEKKALKEEQAKKKEIAFTSTKSLDDVDDYIELTQLLRKSDRERKPVKFPDFDSDSEQSSEESSVELDDLCKTCNKEFTPQKRRTFMGIARDLDGWIYCDVCERWIHNTCEGATLEDLDLDV